MDAEITLGDIPVAVVLKDIKHIHLSVQPPDGRVRIAAPAHIDLDTLRVYAIGKLPWIRQQQQKLRDQARETPRELLNHESHYLWGQRYLLRVIEVAAPPSVTVDPGRLTLFVRPGSTEDRKQEIIASWYRQQVRAVATPLIAIWEAKLGVWVGQVHVQRMKTRWGSCNPETHAIRLNSELAKKPAACLEYILAHELAHLLERHHNDRFKALLDAHMPQWSQYRELLNSLPLAHEGWGY